MPSQKLKRRQGETRLDAPPCALLFLNFDLDCSNQDAKALP